ncbi:MAG TPA: hypothetical protein P5181_03960 [Dermatophilaceae bacterium]|nr:hypothetical protein [Dermatophilaceae bacterium]
MSAVTVAQQAATRVLTTYAASLAAQAARLQQQATALAAQAAALKASAAAAVSRSAGAGGASGAGGAAVSDARLITDRANVVSAEAALAKAKANLAGATLLAPVAGTVGAVPWTVGDTASAASGIPVLSGSLATVTVQVPATSLPSVQVGQLAHVTVTGVAPIDGSVVAVALLPTAASSSSGAAAGASSATTYAVDVLVDGVPAAVGSGGRATVAIVVRSATGVLTVPASAVAAVSTGVGSVGVVKGDQVTRVTVQTGAAGGGKVEVTSGLAPGDVVLLGDASQPLPTNNNPFGGGGLGGLTGGNGGGVRVPAGQPAAPAGR